MSAQAPSASWPDVGPVPEPPYTMSRHRCWYDPEKGTGDPDLSDHKPREVPGSGRKGDPNSLPFWGTFIALLVAEFSAIGARKFQHGWIGAAGLAASFMIVAIGFLLARDVYVRRFDREIQKAATAKNILEGMKALRRALLWIFSARIGGKPLVSIRAGSRSYELKVPFPREPEYSYEGDRIFSVYQMRTSEEARSWLSSIVPGPDGTRLELPEGTFMIESLDELQKIERHHQEVREAVRAVSRTELWQTLEPDTRHPLVAGVNVPGTITQEHLTCTGYSFGFSGNVDLAILGMNSNAMTNLGSRVTNLYALWSSCEEACTEYPGIVKGRETDLQNSFLPTFRQYCGYQIGTGAKLAWRLHWKAVIIGFLGSAVVSWLF